MIIFRSIRCHSKYYVTSNTLMKERGAPPQSFWSMTFTLGPVVLSGGPGGCVDSSWFPHMSVNVWHILDA